MPDYANGKIYKIVNSENDKVYIGSTTQQLYNRMSNHRRQAISLHAQYGKLYKSMRRHGVENFKIKLIKDYPCFSMEQLLAKEFQIIKKYIAKGVALYNTMTVNGKHAASSKRRMSKARKGSLSHLYGKIGKANVNFRRGGISFRDGRRAACVFRWYENLKQHSKSFSVDKYGYDKAKQLAEEYRDKIYPID